MPGYAPSRGTFQNSILGLTPSEVNNVSGYYRFEPGFCFQAVCIYAHLPEHGSAEVPGHRRSIPSGQHSVSARVTDGGLNAWPSTF